MRHPDHDRLTAAVPGWYMRAWPDMGYLLLARVDGEPAAILGAIAGPDWFVFQLATRLPFRGRGIARCLLGRVLAEAQDRGSRAVLINADPEDAPVRLYRRLGFTDEVYWRRTYTLPDGAM